MSSLWVLTAGAGLQATFSWLFPLWTTHFRARWNLLVFSRFGRSEHSYAAQNTGILSFCYWFQWRKKSLLSSRAASESHVCNLYSALSFCSVTAHAHRKSRVHSNNTLTRNVYVMLVYVFLIAVALLCCDMLWYSWSGNAGQISTDLLPAILCSHS